MWELSALIAEVTNNGGNTNWHTAKYAVKCPERCASPMIRLVPIPFGRERARRREHRHALLNLSLQILQEAARRSTTGTVGTIEVRLALHVLRLYGCEQRLLRDYWKAATEEVRHPWTSCHLPYRHIAQHLIDSGAPVDEANRP